MTSLIERHQMIEAHEERFAYALASQVIDKPQLSLWMILVPIIFVHFFYRANRYKTGREEFARNYMISRKRSLDAARNALETGRAPDLAMLADQAKLPVAVLPQYRQFLEIHIDHYGDLLQADGDSFADLVRAAYRSKIDYLMSINRIHQVEKNLNNALKPHMAESTDDFNGVVTLIAHCSETLRRQDAETIYANR